MLCKNDFNYNEIEFKKKNDFLKVEIIKLIKSDIEIILNYNDIEFNFNFIVENMINELSLFIYHNVVDSVIKNINDYVFYIINELNLMISNDGYLFYHIFNDNYNVEFDKENFKIVEVI